MANYEYIDGSPSGSSRVSGGTDEGFDESSYEEDLYFNPYLEKPPSAMQVDALEKSAHSSAHILPPFLITSSPKPRISIRPTPTYKQIEKIASRNVEPTSAEQDVLLFPLIRNPGFEIAYNQLQRYRPGLAGHMYPYLFGSMDASEMPEEYWDILHHYMSPDNIREDAPVLTYEETLALIYLYDVDQNTAQEISDLYEIGYSTRRLPQHLRRTLEKVINNLPVIYAYDAKQAVNFHDLKIKSLPSSEPDSSSPLAQPIMRSTTGLPVEKTFIPMNIFYDSGRALSTDELKTMDQVYRGIPEIGKLIFKYTKKGYAPERFPIYLKKLFNSIMENLGNRDEISFLLRQFEDKISMSANERPAYIYSKYFPDLNGRERELILRRLLAKNDYKYIDLNEHFKYGFTVKMLPVYLQRLVMDEVNYLGLRSKHYYEALDNFRPNVEELTVEQENCIIDFLYQIDDPSAEDIESYLTMGYPLHMFPEHLRERVVDVVDLLGLIEGDDEAVTIIEEHTQEREADAPVSPPQRSTAPSQKSLHTHRPKKPISDTVLRKADPPQRQKLAPAPQKKKSQLHRLEQTARPVQKQRSHQPSVMQVPLQTSQQQKAKLASQQPRPKPTSQQPKPKPIYQQPKPKPTSQQPRPKLTSQQPNPKLTSQQPRPKLTSQQPKPKLTSQQPRSTLTSQQPRPKLTSLQPKPTLTSQQPRSTLTSQQPRPKLTSLQPKPTLTSQQPKRTLTSQQPRPKLTSLQPKPTLTSQQPRSTLTSQQPRPKLTSLQPKPTLTSQQPKRTLTSQHPRPKLTSQQPKPTLISQQQKLHGSSKVRKQDILSREGQLPITSQQKSIVPPPKQRLPLHVSQKPGPDQPKKTVPPRTGKTTNVKPKLNIWRY